MESPEATPSQDAVVTAWGQYQRMKGPVWALVLALSPAVLWTAAPAAAWSNGVNGYKSYGTHDLILDQALR